MSDENDTSLGKKRKVRIENRQLEDEANVAPSAPSQSNKLKDLTYPKC